MKLSACGKVFLAGEYAVLDGGTALVAGVDRRLHATREDSRALQIVHAPSGTVWSGGPAPEQLRFAVRAVQHCGAVPPFRLVYEDEFSHQESKLGLGGSAAATVIAVRAALPGASGEQVVKLAREAHFVEQGNSGSGADVAASALGGVLRFQNGQTRRNATPEDLRLLLAFTGKPADTRALVREVQRFRAGNGPRWAVVKSAIVQAAESLSAALEVGARDLALDAIRAGAAAMARLGEEAQAAIVTPELEQACAISASAGAAAKPSGAGGGDCAVVLAFGDEARDRVERALAKAFPVFRVAPA